MGIYFCITFALAFAFFVRLRIEIVLWKIYIERETGSTVCSSFGLFHLVLLFREKSPRIPFVFFSFGIFLNVPWILDRRSDRTGVFIFLF